MHPIRLLAIALLACLAGLAAGPARAQTASDPLLTVAGIDVDVTAESADAARDKAIAEAISRAFTIAAGRVVPEEKRAALPVPTDKDLGGMLRDFSVEAEKISAVRYIGRYQVRLKPGPFYAFLSGANVPVTRGVAPARLVVPVLALEGAAPVLWDGENPWLAAWQGASMPPSVQPLKVPFGELADVRAASLEQVLAQDGEALDRLAARYGAEGAVVAVYQEQPGGVARLLLRGAGRSESLIGAENLPLDGSGDQAARFKRAMALAMTTLDQKSRPARTVDPAETPRRLTLSLPLYALEDWLAAERRLARIPVVRKVSLAALTRAEARVSVDYVGGLEQLRTGLQQEGLGLEDAPQAIGLSPEEAAGPLGPFDHVLTVEGR